MSVPRAQLSKKPKTTSLQPDALPPDFAPGTVGDFLVRGKEQGWPAQFGAQLGDATINVGRSEVRFECQQCCDPASQANVSGQGEPMTSRGVSYVRISLDLMVECEGVQHVRHVEEMFPCFILNVLHMELDVDAAQRVSDTIAQTLRELDASAPVSNLLNNMIAPMRLYEPLLNALLAPPQKDSLAAWLDEHIQEMLCPCDDTLVDITVNDCRIKLKARDVAIQNNLRASGEVKLHGQVEVCCARTGEKKGEWKSKAVLMKPSLLARTLPSPDDSCKERLSMLTDSWRRRLEENLCEQLSGGPRRFRLSEVMPELPLCNAAEASQKP